MNNPTVKYNELRAVIILVMSLLAFCSFSSFMYDGPTFKVYVRGENIDESYYENKIFDILIKFDESDEWYTDFNKLETSIPKNSELANYCEDGYRSLRVHFRDTVGRDTTVRVSDEWGRKGTSGGNQRHALFCHRYKKCRVAIADEEGNIITVTEPVKIEKNFVNMAYAYMEYYPEYNTVSAGYVISSIVDSYISSLQSILFLSNGFAAFLFLSYIIFKKKLWKYCRIFKILSSLFLIPFGLISIMCVLSSINSFEIIEILKILVENIFAFGWEILASCVSVVTFIFFYTENKRLKARVKGNYIIE